MGVWHETDGLTQIPILGDTPIKLFVVLPTREPIGIDDYEGFNKQLTPAAHPVFLPIAGIYDEYGGIKKIKEGIASRYLECCIKKLREEDQLLINSRHGLYYKDKVFWGAETALKSIGQGHYTFKAHPYDVDQELKTLHFKKMMAKTQDLFSKYDIKNDQISEHSLEELEQKEKTLRKKTIGLKFGLFFVIADLYDAVVAKMKRLNKRDTQTIGSWGVNHEYLHKSIKAKAKSLKSKASKGSLSKEQIDDFFGLKQGLMDSMCCSNPNIVDFSEFCLAQDTEEIKQAIDEMTDYKYFRHFMASARKPWYVALDHRGSQDHEIYLHQTLAKATDKYCREQIAKAIKETN